jgi:AraC-like DNA-binding protein
MDSHSDMEPIYLLDLDLDGLMLEITSESSHDYFIRKVYCAILNRIKNRCNDPYDVCDIAAFLCVSERTLYRRLKEKNKSYFEIKDDIRKIYAIYLLSKETHTIEFISKSLSLKSSSSFAQTFKRWYGCTPKKMITQLRKNTKQELIL